MPDQNGIRKPMIFLLALLLLLSVYSVPNVKAADVMLVGDNRQWNQNVVMGKTLYWSNFTASEYGFTDTMYAWMYSDGDRGWTVRVGIYYGNELQAQGNWSGSFDTWYLATFTLDQSFYIVRDREYRLAILLAQDNTESRFRLSFTFAGTPFIWKNAVEETTVLPQMITNPVEYEGNRKFSAIWAEGEAGAPPPDGNYRKSVIIHGSTAGAQTDYPMGVKVYYSEGTDGTEVIGLHTVGKIYVNTRSEANFSDVYFTESDGSTELDFWMEEMVETYYAIFWVEVSSIPADPDSTSIYIYYGETDGPTASNLDNTFPLFEQFDTDVIGSTWIEQGGADWEWDAGGKRVRNALTSNSKTLQNNEYAFMQNHLIQWKIVQSQWETTLRIYVDDNNWYKLYWHNDLNKVWVKRMKGGGEVTIADPGFAITQGTTYELKMALLNGKINVWVNGVKRVDEAVDGDVLTTSGYIDLLCYRSGASDGYFDDIWVRKYVEPEPYFGEWGEEEGEEEGNPPTNDSIDSDAYFNLDAYGWVKPVVTDIDGLANMKTIDIRVRTFTGAQTFTLRWTQSGNTFSEISDTSGICVLDAENSERENLDPDTVRIRFRFKFTGGMIGACDVRVTSTDDSDQTDVDTYISEFVYWGSGHATLIFPDGDGFPEGSGEGEGFPADVGFPDADSPTYFEWGSSFGDSAFWYVDTTVGNDTFELPWVFEGKKRYLFCLLYENWTLGVDQVGIRFTDSINQNHTIVYDIDANRLTVTSPNDGISGWVEYFEQTGTKFTAIFSLMFNKPIPDSYNVQIQIRVIADSDSGWFTPTGGLFNIYNLGGLATLYDEGMAGRVAGGDVFEIYAADTRTPILIPNEDFDVRQNPIAWWESGITEQELIDDVDWMLWMPWRDEGITMFPTNVLPDGSAPDTRAYNSYPFGLRIMDNDTAANRNMYMEKNFWREIEDTDDELVIVQFHMMNPDVGTPGDPGGGGEIRVSDRSIKEEGFTWMALQFRFDSVGNFTAYNSTASAWVHALPVVDYQWYNVTGVFNITTQMVDVYIDDVLKLDDLPFVNIPQSDSLKTVWVGRANAAVLRNDFYVDDIEAWTNWDKDYGGVSEATILFNQLQHWSMDFDIFVENGQEYAQGASGATVGQYDFADDYSNHGYWELGLDVMINKTLVHDFLVARVNISDGRIGGRDNWIKYNVTWSSQGEYIKNDILYGIFEGYSIFPGSDKDTSGWHWDIWFNRANASTIVGARLNTEYYGMSDKAVWWAVWSSLWKPMRTEVSESSLFIDLTDVNGTIHSTQDVLFVRSWVKILRTSEAEFAYKVVNIAGLDFMVAIDTMSGIDTPPLRKTVVPDVLSGFFGSSLGGIFSAALKRLGNTLAGFGMGFFTMSIEFMDNVFASLGYPALVTSILGWMNSLFSSVPILLGYGITLIGQIFTFVNVSAGNTLNQLATIITVWVDMYGYLMDLISGGLDPLINLWDDLDMNSWIQLGAMLYPFYLLIMFSEKGGQAVLDHINGLLNIASFFLNFILDVGGFFIKLLDLLIGAIRG